MQNPYEILEINRNASDDEVKKAYRELAKKYHPDNFKDNPLSDLASEKMKQINEAYDTIQKERNEENSRNSGSSSYSDSGYSYQSSDASFNRIRELINNNRYSEAEIVLDSFSQSDRNAEWHYLKGVLYSKRGWFFDAQKCFETACKMDPYSNEYKDALYSMRNKKDTHYNNGYRTKGNTNNGCSGCDMCTGLLCADCMCECCGGDLIKCC